MDSNAFQLRATGSAFALATGPVAAATTPVIDDILRDGARRALQSAIEREVQEYIERNQHHTGEDGRLTCPRSLYQVL